MTRRLAVIATIVAAVASMGVSCDKGTPNATPTAVTTLGTPTPQATSTASSTASPKASTATTSPSTAPSGPRVVYFRTNGNARCQSHGPSVTYPGSVILEWEVAGGPTQVTLSIDGPGIYDTYPAKNTITFDFSCTEVSNQVTKHTYLITAVGFPSVKMQITVQATYH